MNTTIVNADAARVAGDLVDGPSEGEAWARAVGTDNRSQPEPELDHPVGRGDRRERGWAATDGRSLADSRENRDVAPERMAGKSSANARSI